VQKAESVEIKENKEVKTEIDLKRIKLPHITAAILKGGSFKPKDSKEITQWPIKNLNIIGLE
jgi:hypothetical protein